MLFICMSAGNTWGALDNSKMDYHDYFETVDAIKALEARSDYVTLKTIGYSYDIPEYPGSNPNPPYGPAYPIYAMRIGPVSNLSYLPQDEGDNSPSILFIGGIHGREWLGSESLLMLAEYLVDRLEDPYPYSEEYALLRGMSVWIIPIANPAGRIKDDQASGDPTDFYKSWGNTEYGWRHSLDRRGDGSGCAAATDIARNFDWYWGEDPDGDCDPPSPPPFNEWPIGDGKGWDNHYEGPAPFSTSEATAIREFVQNHWISMAVDVHTKLQAINNIWRTNLAGWPTTPPGWRDVAGNEMTKRAIEIWEDGLRVLAEKEYPRPRRTRRFGRRPLDIRKFKRILKLWNDNINNFIDEYTLIDAPNLGAKWDATGWLSRVQRIPTFMIELPHDDYYGTIFEFQTRDANGWHPSSSRVAAFIKECFIPMAKYLISQAYLPGSATDIEYVTIAGRGKFVGMSQEIDGSHAGDFGILAAKIGSSGEPDAPGQIDSRPASIRYDPYGGWKLNRNYYDKFAYNDNHELFYWVANNGREEIGGIIELKLKWRPYDNPDAPWESSTEYRTFQQLRPMERVFDSYSIDLEEEMEYELTIKANWIQRPDEFKRNDKKVFRFYTHIPPQLPSP